MEMNLNSLIFPVPKSSYTKNSFYGKLIWIPRKEYSYKDKIKYSNMIINNKNYDYPKKCNTTKPIKNNNTSNNENNSHESKIINHFKTISMIHKVPSITFQIDNKFDESEFESSNNGISNSHRKNSLKEKEYIPCLFLKSSVSSEQLLIYFHSNYEDLGHTYNLCNSMCQNLNINVLSVEYPGYGIYNINNKDNNISTSDEILKDADIIYKFITEIQEIDEHNIYIMGRCIGSGPAIYLAMQNNVFALILLSPIKSIKEAVKTMFPKLNIGNFLQNFVKERFNNYQNIEKVSCPVLLIHGDSDTTIPCKHSEDLINLCKSPAKLVIPKGMTHNQFNFTNDIVVHIRDFIKLFSLNSCDDSCFNSEDDTDENLDKYCGRINLPPWLFICPYD